MNNGQKQIAKPISQNQHVAVGRVKTASVEGSRAWEPSLTIHFPSGVDDQAFYPASDIQLYGTEAITNLRDFCNELLGEEVKAP